MADKQMLKADELPKSPGAKPFMDYKQECEYIRNGMYELASMADSVEIRFEVPDDDCECHEGKWEVEACRGIKRFVGEHEHFANALWFVLQHLSAKDRSEYEDRERRKSAALAKLTASERRLLYLE